MCVLAGLSLLLPDSGLTAIWSWKQDEYRALLGAAPASGVGFLLLGPSPAGYVGESRAWNWHDVDAYPALTRAYNAEDVLDEVRRWRLTHVVVPIDPARLEGRMTEFGARYTRTLVDIGNYRIAEVVAAPPAAPAEDASTAGR